MRANLENNIQSDLPRAAIMPDTTRTSLQRKAVAGSGAPVYLFIFACYILLEPFLPIPLVFMPEILLMASIWLARAALGKIKIPENFRAPPDYPDKRPFWFPRRRYRFEKSRGKGTVYIGYDVERLMQLWLSGSDQLRHTFGAGATGSGKTVTLLGKLFCYLCNGSGTLVNDAKGTNELYFQVLTMMRRMGCVENIVIINFLVGEQEDPLDQGVDFNRVSNTLDLFGSGSPEMLRTTFMGLVRDTGGNGDMWRARVGTLLYGIFVALTHKESKQLITLDLAFIREFINSEAYCFLFFDTKLSTKAQTLVVGYLSEAPNFSLDLAKYFIQKKASELLEMDASDLGIEEILWQRYKVKMNPIGLSAIQPLIDMKKNTGFGGQPQELMQAPQTEPVFREQWGYLSMQLQESFQVLMFEFEHIFNSRFTKSKEISVPDIVLDRLVCLQFMPTLERDKDSFTMMAKIMIGAFKPLFAKGISAKVRGTKTVLLDGMPTNARFPYAIDLDEYPQYGGKAPGMGSAAALVRSMGFALSFLAQQFASLIKENEEEFTHVYGNTVSKFTGLLEDDITIDKFTKRGGKHFVARNEGYEERENHVGQYHRNKRVTIQEEDRIRSRQLSNLAPGEGYFIRGDTVAHIHFFGVLFDSDENLNLTEESQLNYFVRLPVLSVGEIETVSQQLKSGKALDKALITPVIESVQTSPQNADLDKLLDLFMRRPGATSAIPAIISASATEQLIDGVALKKKSNEAMTTAPVAQQPLSLNDQDTVSPPVKNTRESFNHHAALAATVDDAASRGARSMMQSIMAVNHSENSKARQVIDSISDVDDLLAIASQTIEDAVQSEPLRRDLAAFNGDATYLTEDNAIADRSVKSAQDVIEEFIAQNE